MAACFQFYLIMNWSYFWRVAPKFADAALITLKLSAYSIGLSLLLGLAVAVVTAYRVRPLYWPARAYIELSRNTPLLIQLFFLYYGLPKVGIKWDGFTCGILALVFLGARCGRVCFRCPRGKWRRLRRLVCRAGRCSVLWYCRRLGRCRCRRLGRMCCF